MRPALLRLILAATAFVAWIGFLAYLALMTVQTKILSRPQFLVSSLDVSAEVDERSAQSVKILHVYWPNTEEARKLEGETIAIANLAQCEGCDKPGAYILPLMQVGTKYEIAPIPYSPGYSEKRYPIYPRTPQTEEQLRSIPKPSALAAPDLEAR